MEKSVETLHVTPLLTKKINRMKYLFILFSFLCLPASSFGQGVDVSFTKGKKSFILKITNKTTDDIFVRNKTNVAINGSVVVVNFFDGNGVLLNNYGDEWGLGKEGGFWVKKGSHKQFDYEISRISRDLTRVKKVKVCVFLRYYIDREGSDRVDSFSKTENFECSF
ncbi:MAG: hypothetical protein QM654_10070 [Dysgonamonadaceae bacterium]